MGRESLRPLPVFSTPRLWAVSSRRPHGGGGGLELPGPSSEERAGVPGRRCAVPPTSTAGAWILWVLERAGLVTQLVRGRGQWTSRGRRAACGAQAQQLPGEGPGALGTSVAVTAAEGLSHLPTVLPATLASPGTGGSGSTRQLLLQLLLFEAKCRWTHHSLPPRGLMRLRRRD